MSPRDRLLAEELPTGKVRDYQPRRRPWTKAEQTKHVAQLEAALDERPLRIGRRARPVHHQAA